LCSIEVVTDSDDKATKPRVTAYRTDEVAFDDPRLDEFASSLAKDN
jgi:hypothetical protein